MDVLMEVGRNNEDGKGWKHKEGGLFEERKRSGKKSEER